MSARLPRDRIQFVAATVTRVNRSDDDFHIAGTERARLDALASYRNADTAHEPRFDRIIDLAADVFAAPMVYISLVGSEWQWIKASVGLDIVQSPRAGSFCDVTIETDDVMVVRDTLDSGFSNISLVEGPPHIRFYAGAPLVTAGGQRVGTMCIADTNARQEFSLRERRRLADFAALAMEQMDLRRADFARTAMMGFADTIQQAMITTDMEGRVEYVNHCASALFGYSLAEMIGQPIEIIIPERLRGAHTAGIARVAAGGPSTLAGKMVEVVARKRDGSEFPIEFTLSVWRNVHGIGMGAVIRDISERRQRDARLLRLANHDTLTGLCNRQRFETLIAEEISVGRPATVMLLDLDGFKEVNDTLGHAVGDALLQTVAVRLPSALPDNAVVARIGGDEFGALLPELNDPLIARTTVNALLGAFKQPFEFGGHVFQLGASIGYAISPDHGQDPEELIASADFALYRAKDSGGRTSRMFSPEMRSESMARRVLQDELLRALQNDELVLHYQPQVHLEDGRIFGMEALIRWQHPERGLLMPGAFLPALESSALAMSIGSWVLNRSCAQLAEWRDAGINGIRMGVNLFSAQFRATTLADEVRDVLHRFALDPALLELEVTETIALYNDDQSEATIRALRDIGVRIAFDDFGTGYASLSSLKRFPLTTLKIDRSFVRELLTNPQDATIARAMIWMGSQLGLETIVEGIETAEQEAELLRYGAGSVQGYRYGRPMPAEAAAALMRAVAAEGFSGAAYR